MDGLQRASRQPVRALTPGSTVAFAIALSIPLVLLTSVLLMLAVELLAGIEALNLALSLATILIASILAWLGGSRLIFRQEAMLHAIERDMETRSTDRLDRVGPDGPAGRGGIAGGPEDT